MDETMRLIQMAHEGDKAARDQLVEDNVGLVWSIVRRFAGRGHEMEDLFQIGSIGLLKACLLYTSMPSSAPTSRKAMSGWMSCFRFSART